MSPNDKKLLHNNNIMINELQKTTKNYKFYDAGMLCNTMKRLSEPDLSNVFNYIFLNCLRYYITVDRCIMIT